MVAEEDAILEREAVLTNLAKNRTTEMDIRAWLTANGFEGKLAQILDVELHAVQRPGWLQIFRFEAQVLTNTEDNPIRQHFFGVVRDDERERSLEKRTIVMLFDDVEARQEKLDELSEGLLRLGADNSGSLFWLAVVVLGFFVIVFLATKVFAV